MPAKKTQNDFQKQAEEIIKKSHSKKVYFAIAIIFTAIAIGLFIGIAVIVNNYECSQVHKYLLIDEKETVIEQENYYDVLEKKCNDSCCISSLKTMRANNYKEADKNGKCPEGFFMDMLKCVASYQWCVPIKEVEWESCDEDNDCEARFSHCDCQYHCVNKNIEADDCAVECDETRSMISECICEDNKCVDKKSDTSDWQTYRNKEFGFEVKYPEDWIIEKGAGNVVRISDSDDLISGIGEGGQGFSSSILKIIKDKNENPVLLNDIIKVLNKLPQDKCKLNIERTKIGNYPAIKYVDCFMGSPRAIEWVVDKYAYKIQIFNQDQTVNQILSTFKFIE